MCRLYWDVRGHGFSGASHLYSGMSHDVPLIPLIEAQAVHWLDTMPLESVCCVCYGKEALDGGSLNSV